MEGTWFIVMMYLMYKGLFFPLVFLIYALYIFIIRFIGFKITGHKSLFSLVLTFLFMLAPPVFIFGPNAFKHRQAKQRNEANRQMQKESDINKENACKLEHKLTVFKKIPKESGILFSLPKKNTRRYKDIDGSLKVFAKPAFLEWKIKGEKYTRGFSNNGGAILAEISELDNKFSLEETISQYRFSVEEVTTSEDKEKKIHRIQMTLNNRETNELMADYITFHSSNFTLKNFESHAYRGCLKYDDTDEEASNPLHYFFREALDETKIQPLPITDKNTNTIYKSMGYEEVWAFHDGLAVVQKNGKKGFINRQGEIVIPIKFKDVTRFIEKRAIFREGEKWGVINTEGKIILPATYDVIQPFSSGLAFVKKQGEWILVNSDGNPEGQLAPSKHKEIKELKDGFAELTKYKEHRYHGMINSQGKIIIPAIYDSVHYYHKYGLIHVNKGNKAGLINTNGRLIFPLIDLVSHQYENFLARKGRKRGLINAEGKFVIPMKFKSIDIVDANFAKVQLGAYFGFYNIKTGDEIVPAIYDFTEIKHGSIYVLKDKKKGVINAKGDFVIPMEFEDINIIDTHFTKVKRKLYWGVFDTKTGKEIVPEIYDSIEVKHGLFHVHKGEKEGVINAKGDFVIPMEFEGINIIDTHFTKVKRKLYWGVFNTKTGKEIVPAIYDSIEIKHGLFHVHKGEKEGLINTSGIFVIPMDFEHITVIDEHLTKVKHGNRWAVYNTKIGKEIVPAIYGRINIRHGAIHVYKGHKQGLIDAKGKFVIPMEFEKINIIDTHFTKVKRKLYWGVLNTKTGKEIVPIAYDEIKFLDVRPNIIKTQRDKQKKWFNIETGTPVPVEPDDIRRH